MFSGRVRTRRALALLLPIQMLVAFFACASLCLVACGEPEPESPARCQSSASYACLETMLEDADSSGCLLVSEHPAVLSGARPSLGKTSLSVLPVLIRDAGATSASGDVVRRSIAPPPRGRPLERLPVLLI